MSGERISFRQWIERVAHWMPGQLDTVKSWRMVRLWPFHVGVVVLRWDRRKFVRRQPPERCPFCACRYEVKS